MFSALSGLFGWISAKTGAWGWILKIAIILFIVGSLFGAFNGIKSCQYDRANKAFEKRDAVAAEKIKELNSRADASDARAAQATAKANEYDVKILAHDSLAEDKRRLDEGLSAKIDDVVKKGMEVDANTNAPTDCNVRAERAWANFKKLNIDIELDTLKQRFCASTPPPCK